MSYLDEFFSKLFSLELEKNACIHLIPMHIMNQPEKLITAILCLLYSALVYINIAYSCF